MLHICLHLYKYKLSRVFQLQLHLAQSVCEDVGLLTLLGNPSGGTWSGNGVSTGGQYTVISTGSYSFTYTYGTGTCLTTDQMLLTVNPLPSVDAGTDLVYCIDAGTQFLTGTPSTSGGVWTGNGITSGTNEFEPSVAGAGIHVITYTYTDANS